jgi:hypothetical protein
MRNPSTEESRDGRMHRWAAARHGVVTRQELLGLGFSPAAISRRVKEGTLIRLRPRVYRVQAVPRSWLQELYAVCRWLEPDVVVSHRAAARYWQLGDLRQEIIEVTAPTTGRRADDVLIHTTDECKGPESRLTRMLLRLIQRSSLPDPQCLFPVRLPSGVTIHPDLGYPWLKIAIEADGWKEHGKPTGWQGDRDRDNPLQSNGWIVLRLTWYDVTQRPQYCLDTIADALRQRGSLL